MDFTDCPASQDVPPMILSRPQWPLGRQNPVSAGFPQGTEDFRLFRQPSQPPHKPLPAVFKHQPVDAVPNLFTSRFIGADQRAAPRESGPPIPKWVSPRTGEGRKTRPPASGKGGVPLHAQGNMRLSSPFSEIIS